MLRLALLPDEIERYEAEGLSSGVMIGVSHSLDDGVRAGELDPVGGPFSLVLSIPCPDSRFNCFSPQSRSVASWAISQGVDKEVNKSRRLVCQDPHRLLVGILFFPAVDSTIPAVLSVVFFKP